MSVNKWTPGKPTKPGIYRVHFVYVAVSDETGEIENVGTTERFMFVFDNRDGVFYFNFNDSLKLSSQIHKHIHFSQLTEKSESFNGKFYRVNVLSHISVDDWFSEPQDGTWFDATQQSPVEERSDHSLPPLIVKDGGEYRLAMFYSMYNKWMTVDSVGEPVLLDPTEFFIENDNLIGDYEDED